jgi:hypothetical protein
MPEPVYAVCWRTKTEGAWVPLPAPGIDDRPALLYADEDEARAALKAWLPLLEGDRYDYSVQEYEQVSMVPAARGDGGLGEAGQWTIYVCGCGRFFRSATEVADHRDDHRRAGEASPPTVSVEVVPAARLAAAEQRAVQAEVELNSCDECGHKQAEPNWCLKCGHRPTLRPWARAFLDRIDAEKADLQQQVESTEERAEAAERQVEALREDRRQLREALLAYSVVCPCPGIHVQGDVTSGCGGPLHGTDDCPTCAAAALAQQGEAP